MTDQPTPEQLDPAGGARELQATREMLGRAMEELRLIRAKDSNAVYDVTLRTEAHAMLFRQALQGRRRKPQDVKRWPPGTTVEQADAAIDLVCGCGGKYDCDCVSCFSKARRDAWGRHNERRSAELARQP